AMSGHPGSSTACGRAGSRIFAVVKDHTGMQPCIWVHTYAGHEIEKLPPCFGQVFACAITVDLKVAGNLQCLQRDNRELHAGGNRLDRQARVNRVERQAASAGYRFTVVLGAESGILLSHLSEGWFAVPIFK